MHSQSTIHQLRTWALVLLVIVLVHKTSPASGREAPSHSATLKRPNILFCIADDWGWPHAGAYGDRVVRTPTFDRIAAEGVLFSNAFVSAPSCTPSRNAILTGQYHWRLGWGGNLHSMLDTKHRTYPHLLEDAGYFTGHWRKSWGPGKLDNWKELLQGHPAGKKFKNFDAFLAAWPRDQPFCFWLGASDPHRPYKKGSGVKSGLAVDQIELFEHFPDSDLIRSDVADYYVEVERFDHDVSVAIGKLESLGVLENTLVVMTGDHGMPFPRCKANLYDSGTRVPMAVRWPGHIHPGRIVTDFVNTIDLAPTFLEVGRAEFPAKTSGHSWTKIFESLRSGRIEADRNHVLTGKERHVPCQEGDDSGGTPMRAIRTDKFLLVHNYRPDRWPAGTPNHKIAYIRGCWYGDCDNGPTKSYMIGQRDIDDEHREKYTLAFAKRPEFELYDLDLDPGQIHNVAGKPQYQKIEKRLKQQLKSELIATNDPREMGNAEEIFDKPKYFGHGPRYPHRSSSKR